MIDHRTLRTALLGALAAFALAACTGESPPADGASRGDAPGADASYARNAADNSWPPLEDGAAPQVAPEALAASNYYVVLDGSGSMLVSECSDGARKIDAAITALERFVEQVPPDANLGLAVFDASGLSERVPLANGNHDVFRGALQAVSAEGGTPLRSAITLGYERLTAQARRQLGYGDYHLVVVTDGVPDPASEMPTAIVRSMLAESPVVLHTIGFCIGEDHVLNQPGRTYYVAANSPEQLQQGLGSVLAEAPSFDVATFKDN
jgi:hypothetical protein